MEAQLADVDESAGERVGEAVRKVGHLGDGAAPFREGQLCANRAHRTSPVGSTPKRSRRRQAGRAPTSPTSLSGPVPLVKARQEDAVTLVLDHETLAAAGGHDTR